MGTLEERLKEAFRYAPNEGVLYNAYGRTGKTKEGIPAGSIRPRGYIQIMFDYTYYQATNIIWLLMTGVWPKGLVDHIDGNPLNNKWTNLRDVSPRDNSCNTKRSRAGGLIGASYRSDSGKWRAYITVGKRRTNLGTYPTEKEAHARYEEALSRLNAGLPI